MNDLSAVDQLEQALSTRSQPLLIRIDDGSCIVGAHYEFDSQHYAGVVFRHPEGPIDIGINPPCRSEYYAQYINDFDSMSIEEKREAIIVEITGDDPLPGTESKEFEAWLAELVDDEFVPETWIEDADETLGEGTPGFLILAYLSNAEAEELGIRKVDLGGPASSCPMVEFSGEPEMLQRILEEKGLPLRLVFGH